MFSAFRVRRVSPANGVTKVKRAPRETRVHQVEIIPPYIAAGNRRDKRRISVERETIASALSLRGQDADFFVGPSHEDSPFLVLRTFWPRLSAPCTRAWKKLQGIRSFPQERWLAARYSLFFFFLADVSRSAVINAANQF